MKTPSKCPICNKSLSVKRGTARSNNVFLTCYRGNLRTEDIVVHFECVIREEEVKDEIVEIYMEVGNYYLSIFYDSNPGENNFFLYRIQRDDDTSTKESLILISKMAGFYPAIDFDDIDSLMEKIEVWQTFN